MGVGHLDIARTRPSSLNAIRCSKLPPPITSRITSTLFLYTSRRPLVMASGAPLPSTGTPAKYTVASGYLLRKVRRTSWTTAPRGEVTKPIRSGKAGSGRFLDGSNKPSARKVRSSWATFWRSIPSPAKSIDEASNLMSPFSAQMVKRPVMRTRDPTSSWIPALSYTLRHILQYKVACSSLMVKKTLL